MVIQKLRLQHGWSQEQLAQASGLSARTIQRIEAGGVPSTESLKSLAAVFDVDFSTLKPEPAMPDATLSPALHANPADLAEHQEAEAFAHVRKLKGFYRHLLKYVLVVALLAGVNLLVSPHRLWVQWVVLGWGLGLLGHALRVFWPDAFLGAQWEKAQVEKRLGRPL